MSVKISGARRFAGTIALFGLFGLFSGCAGSDSPSTESPATDGSPEPGRLVIVGGALAADNVEVYQAVITAREGTGPLCIIPTASGVPDESMASAIERFQSHGAPAVEGIWITTENPEAASDPAVVEALEACSGYWFVGGSQSRVMDVFRPNGQRTPADSALHRRWQAGAVVSGSSAGAAMMPSRSIGGGSSAEAMEFGVTHDDEMPGVWVMDGMDFVPWAMIGQHHLARGRWGRLVIATLEEPGQMLGLGIDENTALVYENGVARVLGASGVLMVDVANATRGANGGVTGVRLELLGAGDGVSAADRLVLRAGGKSPVPMPVSGPSVSEIADAPFERWAFLHLLHRMAADAAPAPGGGAVVELNGGARTLRLRRGDGFFAGANATEGVQGTPFGLTLGPLVLEIGPRR